MLCDSYEQSPSNPLKRVCRECSSTDRHLNRSCAGHIPKHGEIAFALSKPEALAVKKDLGSKTPEEKKQWYRDEKQKRKQEDKRTKRTFSDAKGANPEL